MKSEIRKTGWIAVKDGPWYPTVYPGGIVAYRIWMKDEGTVNLSQRHEWKFGDGTTKMDDWIRSSRPALRGFPKHYHAA